MSANQANYKSSEVLLIGDSVQSESLAAHFKRKLNKDDSMQMLDMNKDRKSPSVSKRPKGTLELSKLDLRKKMMEYGKKPDKVKRLVDDSQQGSPVAASHPFSNQSTPSLSGKFGVRNSSPRPEVLERLSRGIKPKVDKSEIHQITRRHLEKFSKLNTNTESAASHQTKRAELMERRLKVKELDKVTRG